MTYWRMLMSVGTPMNNAVMPIQFEANVPNLFPISGGRQMVEPFHPMKFTQRGIYYDEVRASVKYFIEKQGKTTPCVIHQDTDYGVEILEGAQDQAAAMGLEIAAISAHKPTDAEFTAAILRLKNAGCDLVLMGTVHRDTILVLDAARKMGWDDVAWVGNNAAYAQVIADQESGEGYYAFVHMAKLYPDDEMTPEVKAWWDAYVERYDVEPGLAAMEGYRAADLTVLALERAGRDLTTAGLLKALESITDYTDIFGYKVSFSAEKHSGATESVLSQVQRRAVGEAGGVDHLLDRNRDQVPVPGTNPTIPRRRRPSPHPTRYSTSPSLGAPLRAPTAGFPPAPRNPPASPVAADPSWPPRR